jgi:hypothetical protein
MSAVRLGPRGLDELRDDLSGRDLAIAAQVADLRFMSGKQIETVHFALTDHANEATAARSARRVLERLVREQVLIRLRRRVGGVRAGSASFVYALGPVGRRVLHLPGPRKRFREPSTTFALHTLDVAELVVKLIVGSREQRFDLLCLQPEPRSWRDIAGIAGSTVLRPDLFVNLGVGEYEHRWFVEVDRGTEHLPTLITKALTYESYFQSGVEQAKHGVFPKVLWQMHKPDRAARLRRAIDQHPRLTSQLFEITTTDHTLDVLSGERP